MDNATAYFILVREMTNMHHTERTALDNSPQYQETLDAVKANDTARAIELAQALRTEQGEANRAKRGVPFATGLNAR